MNTLTKAGTAVAATATLALGVTAGTAGAAEVGLPAIKAAAHQAIVARVGALNTAIGVVDQSSFMGADQATLVNGMHTDITGLTQLDQTIQADTTVATAKADAQKVFTEFRIYALVLPVVHMVRASDLVTAKLVPDFNTVETKLQAAITKQDEPNLEHFLDDMKTKVGAAQQAVSPLPAQLEALTPVSYNANHAVLQPARETLETARTDLRAAREDAHDIVAGLKK